MIFTFLFLIGIYGITTDLMNNKRSFIAILWNNMRFYILPISLYWILMSMLMLIYNIETLTGVFTKIGSMGLWVQVQIWVATSVFGLTLLVFMIVLIFKSIPYKEKEGVNNGK